jgi:hypothetical protein
VGLEEGVEYPHPSHHYETEQIVHLAELVELLLDGEDRFDELEEHLQLMEDNFTEFEKRYALSMQSLLASESMKRPEDQYSTKLSYVLRTGLRLFHEGKAAFAHFFATESEDPDELEAAFCKTRDGNDYVCLALELAEQRLAELEKVIALHPEAQPDS